ncbi:Hypothetical protein CAP_3476 [Chondromyces apiculatus DSM 436]|uniref:Uncharacterized protein n=1 Tax=Chondromyces apiculatus DSM 436 TaxID=1192034 RepID=A0A017T791_9BACT|nr:Hypothetical protein CAP_3476 [Chondromyces apiculatus DSM 436]
MKRHEGAGVSSDRPRASGHACASRASMARLASTALTLRCHRR